MKLPFSEINIIYISLPVVLRKTLIPGFYTIDLHGFLEIDLHDLARTIFINGESDFYITGNFFCGIKWCDPDIIAENIPPVPARAITAP